MAEKKRFLRLESLVAHMHAEADGDEVFIKFKDKKIAPKGSKFVKATATPVSLNIEVELDKADKWIELELWDYDRFSPNDLLGKFKLLVDKAAESFTAELERKKDSDARYVLNWSVIERMSRKVTRPATR